MEYVLPVEAAVVQPVTGSPLNSPQDGFRADAGRQIASRRFRGGLGWIGSAARVHVFTCKQ